MPPFYPTAPSVLAAHQSARRSSKRQSRLPKQIVTDEDTDEDQPACTDEMTMSTPFSVFEEPYHVVTEEMTVTFPNKENLGWLRSNDRCTEVKIGLASNAMFPLKQASWLKALKDSNLVIKVFLTYDDLSEVGFSGSTERKRMKGSQEDSDVSDRHIEQVSAQIKEVYAAKQPKKMRCQEDTNPQEENQASRKKSTRIENLCLVPQKTGDDRLSLHRPAITMRLKDEAILIDGADMDKYIKIEEKEGEVSITLKFATNMTSKRHEEKKFRVCATMSTTTPTGVTKVLGGKSHPFSFLAKHPKKDSAEKIGKCDRRPDQIKAVQRRSASNDPDLSFKLVEDAMEDLDSDVNSHPYAHSEESAVDSQLRVSLKRKGCPKGETEHKHTSQGREHKPKLCARTIEQVPESQKLLTTRPATDPAKALYPSATTNSKQPKRCQRINTGKHDKHPGRCKVPSETDDVEADVATKPAADHNPYAKAYGKTESTRDTQKKTKQTQPDTLKSTDADIHENRAACSKCGYASAPQAFHCESCKALLCDPGKIRASRLKPNLYTDHDLEASSAFKEHKPLKESKRKQRKTTRMDHSIPLPWKTTGIDHSTPLPSRIDFSIRSLATSEQKLLVQTDATDIADGNVQMPQTSATSLLSEVNAIRLHADRIYDQTSPACADYLDLSLQTTSSLLFHQQPSGMEANPLAHRQRAVEDPTPFEEDSFEEDSIDEYLEFPTIWMGGLSPVNSTVPELDNWEDLLPKIDDWMNTAEKTDCSALRPIHVGSVSESDVSLCSSTQHDHDIRTNGGLVNSYSLEDLITETTLEDLITGRLDSCSLVTHEEQNKAGSTSRSHSVDSAQTQINQSLAGSNCYAYGIAALAQSNLLLC